MDIRGVGDPASNTVLNMVTGMYSTQLSANGFPRW